MKILVINGPNLNVLGYREPDIYGTKTYKDLVKYIKTEAKELGIKVKIVQFNEEGKIVTAIQKARGRYDGLIINAGAYTHTGIAILDALKSSNLNTVEVHLSDIYSREEFRKTDYIKYYVTLSFMGEGFLSYKKALESFKN